MDHMKSWDGTKVFIGPKNSTVDLTATSNSEIILVDTNDDKDQNYQLSNTDDEKNDETKDPIEAAKQSPSDTAQNHTYILAYIATVSIVAKNLQLFQVLKKLLVYHQFIYQGKHHLSLR